MLLTIFRLILVPVLLLMFAFPSPGTYVAALLILALAMFTDWLDGYIARRDNLTTDLGKLADPLADSFIYVSLFAGFVASGWMPLWLFAVVMFRELTMHSFLRPYLLSEGRVLAANKWGKLKTLFQTVTGIAVLIALSATAIFPTALADYVPVLKTIALVLFVIVASLSAGSMVRYAAELRQPKTAKGESRES